MLTTFPSLLSTGQQILNPVVILILSITAGVGTVLALPGRKETPWVKIGGIVLLAAFLVLAALLVHHTNASYHPGGMGIYFWVFSAVAVRVL